MTKRIRTVCLLSLAGLTLAAPSLVLAAQKEKAPAPQRNSNVTTRTKSAPPSKNEHKSDPLPPTDGIPAPTLRSEAVLVQSLGLSMFLPDNSEVTTNRIAGGETKVIVTGPEKKWLLQVSSSASKNLALTADKVLDDIIEQRKRTYAMSYDKTRVTGAEVVYPLKVMGRTTNLNVGGLPAARVYIGTPADGEAPMTGYTIVTIGKGQFAVFQLDTPAPNFNEARVAYETIIAAAKFRDPAEANLERKVLIDAGRALMGSLSSEDYEAAFDAGEPTVLRTFIPGGTKAAGDDAEKGFQIISIRKGQLGEVNPLRPKTDWTTAEREFGYVVEIKARQLLDTDAAGRPGANGRPVLLKSNAVFFLSRDLQHETWSIVNEIRNGDDRKHYSQTVVRQERHLTSKTDGLGAEPEIAEWDLPDGAYLSKFEQYALPRMIAAKNVSGLYGFYHFDMASSRITLRREEFKRASDGWMRISQNSEDAEAETLLYNTAGIPLPRKTRENAVVQPVTLEQLTKLWKSKGLAMD